VHYCLLKENPEMTSPDIVSFKRKENHAKEIIKTVLAHAKNPCICFSGGKKSLVLLHLIKSVTRMPLTVIFINTTVLFEDTCHYVEKMRKLWGFQLVISTPQAQSDTIARETDICCNSLIIAPLCEIIQKNGFDYVFIGSVLAEDRMKRLLDAHPEKKKCIPVSPAEHFLNEDIWQYIHAYNLPYCSLYDKGYTTVDCKPCSQIDEFRQKNSLMPNEEELIKEKLKKLGYL
jgi:phosphoadenosine phosphosulfate reductase